jgi:hypothetical protein
MKCKSNEYAKQWVHSKILTKAIILSIEMISYQIIS